MLIGRRQFSKVLATSLATSLALSARLAHAKDTALPVPTSLPQAALAAKAQGQPLVLLISLPGCVYCELVRRSYLIPLLADTGLQAWQLDITNRSAVLMGFDGKATTAERQAKAWKATFTPTLLFLGSQGQELAERLVGIAVPDFYGNYLEQRLVMARKASQLSDAVDQLERG
jgi:thioredoxin-related protein